MAEKANQHYVPQYYFRYFSRDQRSICLLTRSTGKTVYSASIRGQSSKKYYYGDSSVENSLGEIDTIASDALREVKRNHNFEDCTPENYAVLLQNIMLQRSRTATERKRSKAMYDKIVQLQYESAISNDDVLDENTRDGFLEIARSLEADEKQAQLSGMEIAVEQAENLTDLLPILISNRTNRPFIFGDAPVVFINPLYKKIKLRGVLGLRTPGLIVFYPLGPNHCVMLIDEEAYRIKNFRSSSYPLRNLSDVALINKLQIHNAESAIYYSEPKYEQYVAGLWNEEKQSLVDHVGNVHEAPGVDQDGDPIGDIIHFFDQQLPLIPRFSFLDYLEVQERDYKFSARRAYV